VAAGRGSSISVLVVDDHRTFAEALALAVGLERGLVAHVAASGPEAVEAAHRWRPDVVLMDIEMPGMDGLAAIRRVREAHSSARIIVLSVHDDDLVKAQAVEAGAVGYVSKLTPLSEVPQLVRRAHRGDAILDQQEVARLMRLLRHRRHQESTERQRANRLTSRQIEILRLVAEGVPGQEIARRLNMSPLTVRTHVQNILTRLGVHTKLEAVALAMRHGKIPKE
jgi:two-component system nitrate/nitrite response regulator NarL